MGNCFISKLRGEVDDNLLPKVGDLQLNIINGASANLQITSSMNIEVVSGNITLGGSGEWRTIAAQSDGIISVNSKYNLALLRCFDGIIINDMSILKYCPITNFAVGTSAWSRNLTPGIKKMSDITDNLPLCTKLSIRVSTNLVGNISELVSTYQNSLIELDLAGCVGVEGDFATFGLFKLLTNLNGSVINTNISGSIEGFVANKRSVNVTSGSCSCNYMGDSGRISFNGSIITSNSSTFTWTENTITYDGVTIDA